MIISNNLSGAADIELSTTPNKTGDNLSPSSQTGKTAKELFEEFYSGVTLHGFRFLFEGHSFRRILWLFITTSVFAFSILLFYELVKDFHQRKTITLTTKKFLEDDIVFPTVTVCPNNGFSKSKTENNPFNISKNDFHAAIDDFEWNTNSTEETTRPIILEELEKRNVTSFMEYLRLTRIDKKDMLESKVSFFSSEVGSRR